MIVTGSVLSIVVFINSTSSLKGALTVVRSFRILRIARLIKRARSLNLIFHTFVVTLPGLANIGGLLLLLLYLYSIIGVQLIGQVKRNGMFTDNLNFETFIHSFCALCAIATGDSWGTIVNNGLASFSIVYECIDSPTYQDYADNDF